LADRYTIERELGAGGMATVYLAHDLRHDRRVALKVLRPDLAASLGPERFLREVRIAANLQHPNVLAVYDSGEAAGFLYYVMPYVEGPSLRESLSQHGELPVPEAARILRDVADALAAAHAKGVVHRDIKPENIMLSGRHALVADFGVAKAVSEATGQQTLTTAGVALGTPTYMAPEQGAADPHTDHRADLFAFGVMAYEMLTGQPPFVAPTPQAVLSAHVTEAPVPVTQRRATIPPPMAQLIMRCLAKKPADRPQTAEELLPVLESFSTPSGGITPTDTQPVPGVRSGRRRWRRLALFGLAAVVVVAGALMALRRGHEASSPNSVAVLYLANLSRDTADAFLADGLTEEIIIRLGQVPRLDVKSRFEVERFRGKAATDPAVLAKALGTAYLVTGSVQRAGDRVVLRYEVIRAATRAQVAGDVIDTASSDLLTVESDIAREVATAITGKLLPEERLRLTRRLTSDPVAYEEYLRGLEEMNHSFDEAEIRSALAHFDRAIAQDSTFASAFASKAVAWEILADGYISGRDGYGQSRVAAARALALDSSQAAAYAMLGFAALTLDLDAHQAERLGRRAVELDPRADQPHFLLCTVLLAEGRMEESIEEGRRAWEADSLFSANGLIYAFALIYGHRLDGAAALVPRLRAIGSPADADALEGQLLAARGDFRGAERFVSWRYYGGWVAGTYVRALLARGDTAAARATVDSMLAARTPGYYNPIALAKAYAALGNIDRGIEWLRRAFDERTAWLTWVRTDPDLAPLRADPRYAALDRQLHY